jgi:SAM-dependent methyltransferase
LTDRHIELPRPDRSLHPVGRSVRGSAWRQVVLLRHYGLGTDTRLLEIGCGIGRLAYELGNRSLGGGPNPVLTNGRYDGFDISARAIAWLNEHYSPVLPNFSFTHIDVANSRYNPSGRGSAATTRFPFADASYDMVCAFSVFTHMIGHEITWYLTETRRLLTRNGRAVVTVFAIGEDDTDPASEEGKPFVRLPEPGVWTIDPEVPERGIGHDEDLLLEWFRNAGFDIVDRVFGMWHDGVHRDKTRPRYSQDAFVLSQS